jgi:hypothetical protein
VPVPLRLDQAIAASAWALPDGAGRKASSGDIATRIVFPLSGKRLIVSLSGRRTVRRMRNLPKRVTTCLRIVIALRIAAGA